MSCTFVEKLRSHKDAPQEILKALKIFYDKKSIIIKDLQATMLTAESDTVSARATALLPEDPIAVAALDVALEKLREELSDEGSTDWTESENGTTSIDTGDDWSSRMNSARSSNFSEVSP